MVSKDVWKGIAGVLFMTLSPMQAGERALPAAEAAVVVENEEPAWSASLSAAWDSLYVSEGRDNLDGESLFGTTLGAESGGFLAGMWYANAPNNGYDEFNAFIEYGFELRDFEFYAGYAYLNFPSDDEDDHEVGAGLAYNGLPYGITPGIDWYYSYGAEGSFLEASLSREILICEWLVVSPMVLFGFNEGYIAEGHDGVNHVAFGAEAAVSLRDHIALGGYVAYSLGVNSDPGNYPDDELLDDFFYGGIAVTFAF